MTKRGTVSRTKRRTFGAVVRIVLSAGLVFTSASKFAFAQPMGPHRVFTPGDIFSIRAAEDVQISPVGRRVAYVQTANAIMTDRRISTLWIADSDGAAPRLLAGAGAGEPRWSPDGGRLAYLAPDARGDTQILLTDAQGGSPTTLTHLQQGPQDIAWAPDGRSIAFRAFVPEPEPTLSAPVAKPVGATWAPPLRFIEAKSYLEDGSGFVPPGHIHLFLVDVASGAVRQQTSGSSDEGAPAWSPDSRALVYSSKGAVPPLLDFAADRIFEFNLASGRARRVSRDPIVADQPVVSPDGRRVAFIGHVLSRPGAIYDYDVYVMDRDGSHARVLAPTLDRVAYSPRWTADGSAVLAAYADRGVGKVARFGMDGDIRVLADHLGGDYSVARDGTVAFALSGSDHPADVGLAVDGVQHRLVRLNDDWLPAIALGAVKPLPVRSSLDSVEVGAWLKLPPGYRPGRRYPMILFIHGGPYGEDGPDWDTDAQVFAGAGYVVLQTNYRGSASYGLKFASGVDRDFPGAAYDDLMSATDAAVESGVADPRRLFVTGGSAGGELTAWTVGKTARFRAAAAVKPVIDLVGDELGNDQYLYGATNAYGATPWADPLIFWRHSPLSLVGNVSTPTLLVVGLDDHRTPMGQAMEFYDALQIRGVPTGLVIVPGAGHENLESRPSQRGAEDAAILAWFARYDGLGAAPSSRPVL